MKAFALFAFAAALAALGTAPAVAGRFGSYAVPQRLAPSTARVTVALPLRNKAELANLLRLQADPRSPEFAHFITPAQFRARYGPDAATFAAVIASLRRQGLHVDDVSTQSLHASGSPRAMAAAFGTTIGARRFANEPRARLVASSPMHLDATLRKAGAIVVGLQAIPAKRRFSERSRLPLNRYSAEGPDWFTDFKQAYSFPATSVANGKGATIGIVMSNDILNSDLAGIFNHEKYTAISGLPSPTITRHRIDGGSRYDPNMSFEPSLDVQESLGSAPGANLAYYITPELDDQSINDAYTQVVEDNVADVISSSFGACELFYEPSYNGGEDFTSILTAEQQLFMQGNAQGQTFVASSGDNAGLPCPSLDYFNGMQSVYVPGVSDPASDPNVTAVGGTNLVTTSPPSPQPSPARLKSAYIRESEFADPLVAEDPYGVGVNLTNGLFGSGSGQSVIWPKPDAQKLVNTGTSMRAVPDISMQMGGCPYDASSCGADDSASIVEVGGTFDAVIGTSSSSPEFAGLLAVRIGAFGHRLGNVNTALYALAVANQTSPIALLHTKIPGNNGVVTAPNAPMLYNPIVGVGTPVTQNLIGLPYTTRAGNPQTVTNP